MGALAAPRAAVLVRLGELTLKGANRGDFERALQADVRQRLQRFGCRLTRSNQRLIVDHLPAGDDAAREVAQAVAEAMGVHSAVPCLVCERTEEGMLAGCLQAIKKAGAKSFKLEARRQDKRFPVGSRELNVGLGKRIQELTGLTVSMDKPATTVNIEVRTDAALVYVDEEMVVGSGGLPVGTGGRVLCLLSGGIDSPVAAYLLARRGQTVDFLTFVTPPHTRPEALKKAQRLAGIVNARANQNGRLYVCNFTDVMHELNHIEPCRYRVVAMRRCFMRIASRLARQIGAAALATGEALGQVASQTLESMAAIDEASELLVLRPLLAMDKAQIVDMAKSVGTYETSIERFADACEAFAPAKPVTKAQLDVVRAGEERLLMLEPLVAEAPITTAETV